MDYEEYGENKLKQFRKISNTKIDIFQSGEEPCFRNLGKNKNLINFEKSFEHDKMKNDSFKILSRASNSVLYSIANNMSLSKTNHNLKKIFSLGDVVDKDNQYDKLEKKYTIFIREIKMKKLKHDPEYLRLCEFIDHPNFDKMMRSDQFLLRTILKHKYLKFHEKYKQIKKTYLPLLNKYAEVEEEEEEEN